MKNRIKSIIISLIFSFTFCSLYAADLESEKTYEVEVNGTRIERVIKSTCRNGYIHVSFFDSQKKEFDHLGAIVKKGDSNYTLNQNNQWEETDLIGVNLSELDDEQTIGVGIVPSSIIQECRIKTGMNTSTSISVHDSIQLPFANGFNGCAIFLLGIKDGCIKEVLKGKINSELLKAESKFTGSDNEITGKVYKKFISDSNLDGDILVREELATLFAYSIQNGKEKYGDQFFYNPGNIEKSGSPYLQLYLNTLYEKNYPVLTSQLYSSDSIPDFGKIDSDVENNLVDAANRYLNWAVEYTIVGVVTPTTNEIYKDVNGSWGNGNDKKIENYWPGPEEFPNDEVTHVAAGNPMPYVKGGIDTPRTFWKKMQWVYGGKKFIVGYDDFLGKTSKKLNKAVGKKKYESFDEVKYKGKFVAGTGDDLFKYAGTDDFGFLTGVLSMSGAESSFVGANKIKAAENLDEYSKELLHLIELKKGENEKKIFELEGMQNKRFEISDLEYFSVIVPDYKKIQRGDIVVKDDNNEVTLGVVVQFPVNKEEETDYLKDIKVVYIDKNKVTGSAFNSGYAKIVDFKYFYENDFTVRRLVTNNSTGGKVYARDVLDKKFSENTKLTVDKFTEMGSQDPNSWRFIPNTGEFLVLEGIKLVAKNNAGVNVIALYSEDPKYEYTVEEFYAKDRSYNNSTNQAGNIYNNTSDEFEIIPFNGINTIIKETDVTINDSVYKIKTNETDKSVYRSYNDSEDSSKKLVLKINPDGTFKTDSGNYAKVNIGIRPVTAAKAFPGDDLILGVKFEGIEEPLYLDEKDYVAVYDKKMLWRANLYIDEKEDVLGNLDWNSAHPWNAPPAADATAGTWADNTKNSYFAGWNANDWGYNEWNRKYDLGQDSEITNLILLEVGKGGQVIKFSEYSPYRTAGSNVNNKVSYDYPGDSINAWDSPFDFVYKMNEQKKALRTHFTAKVNEINMSNLSENDKKKELDKAGVFPNGTGVISGNTVSVKALSEWSRTVAPNNKWKYYWKVVDNGTTMLPYIPGLGMNVEHKNYSYTGETENFISTMTFPAKLSAGTDCLGYVKRTSYYKNNGYTWSTNQMQYDRVEGNATPDEKGKRKSEPLAYPKTDYSYKIISRIDISNTDNDIGETKEYFSNKAGSEDGPSTADFYSIQQKFLQIVPGDVIYYDSSHIGEIKDINYDAVRKATTFNEMMGAVTVAESVYNVYTFYITTRTMLQAQHSDITNIAMDGSWHLKNSQTLRNWEIRRLRR